jgi:hypothetical protein
MTEFRDLPLAERVKRYRQLARDAKRYASGGGPTQQSYLVMSEQWEKMAQEAESLLAKGRGSR